VNKLVADFTRMRSMMQQMTQGNFPAGFPGGPGGGGAPKQQKPKKKKKGFGTL
jgi:signal recognition particle subunit SRP54